MLFRELKRAALRREDMRHVVQAINPIEAHYSGLMHKAGFTYDNTNPELHQPTVEWYIENIQDLSIRDMNIWNFGPKTKAFLDYLIDTYYLPEEEDEVHYY